VPEMTKEQILAISQYLMGFYEILGNMAPSVDPNVERLRDLYKTICGSTYTTMKVLFGEDECSAVRDLIEKVVGERLGFLPDITPEVIQTGAKTGVFKDSIYGSLDWKRPEDI
jgi:hypothetical protein